MEVDVCALPQNCLELEQHRQLTLSCHSSMNARFISNLLEHDITNSHYLNFSFYSIDHPIVTAGTSRALACSCLFTGPIRDSKRFRKTVINENLSVCICSKNPIADGLKLDHYHEYAFQSFTNSRRVAANNVCCCQMATLPTFHQSFQCFSIVELGHRNASKAYVQLLARSHVTVGD